MRIRSRPISFTFPSAESTDYRLYSHVLSDDEIKAAIMDTIGSKDVSTPEIVEYKDTLQPKKRKYTII